MGSSKNFRRRSASTPLSKRQELTQQQLDRTKKLEGQDCGSDTGFTPFSREIQDQLNEIAKKAASYKR